MTNRDSAELAAITAIMSHLIAERQPSTTDTKDPIWRSVFEDTYYLASRFGAVYARTKTD